MDAGPLEKISLEKAMELLRKDGIEVTMEQAKIILVFLSEIAEIVVDEYLSRQV
jgi:hypothetical protein